MLTFATVAAALADGARVGSEAEVASDDAVNLRTGPGTDSAVVTTAEPNRIVFVRSGPVTNTEGEWFRVEYDGDIGWMLGSYLALPRASSLSSRGGARSGGAPVAVSRGQAIAQRALQYVGYPYVWGGTGPRWGFDCSGLVQYVMGLSGVYVPRTTDAQAGAGVHVSTSDLRPGDLVVFANTYESGYSHDGIYIGGGRFVHAEDERTGVVVSSLFGGYWGAHYAGARRPW